MGENSLISFLNFDLLILPRVIQWVWIIGVALIVYVSVVMMTFRPDIPWYVTAVSSPAIQTAQGYLMIGGFVLLILGNLVWRMICEILVLLCSLRDQGLPKSVERR